MRHFISALALITASAFTTNVEAQTQPITTTTVHSIDDFYRYLGPDVDLQVGAGYHWETVNANQDTTLGMGRLRLGYLWVTGYPWAVSAGMTLELNTTTTPVWGLQAEVLNLGAGVWLRGGGGLDYQVRPHYNMALGWSIAGVEVDGFAMGPYDNRQGVAVLGVVRIPLGYLGYVVSKLK